MTDMLDEALDMIEKFLADKYDPMAFSYDLPVFLVEHYDEIYSRSPRAAKILNDNIPDVCADYEEGYPIEKFKQRIRDEYDRALPTKFGLVTLADMD